MGAARKRKMDTVLSKFRQEIARGVPRNEAIADARKAGATLTAMGEVLGITRQSLRRILNRQRLRKSSRMRTGKSAGFSPLKVRHTPKIERQ
jgi:hypothetical protein